MTTLLLSPRYTTDSRSVRAAAIKLGWNVFRLPGWRPPEDFDAPAPVAYGEPLFVASVCQFLGLSALEAPFDWLTLLPRDLLLREISFSDLEAARQRSGPLFVKPADNKCFAAKVYDNPLEIEPGNHLPSSTPTLTSEPVDWSIEYRAFILDRKVLTLSPYLRSGKMAQSADGSWPSIGSEERDAIHFLTQLTENTQIPMPPGLVIDVGHIPGRGWAVIEANPAWGSGIYGCDPEAVCRVLESTIIPNSKMTDQLRKWIPHRIES